MCRLLRFRVCIMFLVAAFICNLVRADNDVDEKLLVKLQGEWEPVSSVYDGKESKLDQGQVPSFVIEDRTMSLRFGDRVAARFEIKHLVTKGPLGHIDYSGQDPLGNAVRIKQLFKLEGNTLTTCSVLPPGSDRPTELSSKAGSKHLMAVSERKRREAPESPKPADYNLRLLEQLAPIKFEYNAVETAACRKLAAVEDITEREPAILEYMEELNRKGSPLIEKAFAVIRSRAAEPDAAAELAWIVESEPASDSANLAARLLGEHHLTSDATAKLAASFIQTPLLWTEDLLRKLAAADLPREKQGQALLQLALCIQAKASVRQLFENFEGKTVKAMEMRFGKQNLAELRSADPATLEQTALRMFDDVSEKCGDVSYGGKTIAELAKSAVFEIENLGISKTAPEIEGTDIDGVAFKLSDYRGRVVLLEFWGNWCGACRVMYSSRQSLEKRLQGLPFAIVGINSDPDRESLKQVIGEEQIRWRSFWDGGTGGPIATRWNVRGWPTIYVIDHNGVIRVKGTNTTALDRIIDELVAKAGEPD